MSSWCRACLRPPSRSHKNPRSKVQWSSKLLFLSPCPLFLPCVSFWRRLFSRLRWDTSARWVSPRRKRWPPADTSRWPPLPAPGQLHLNFSCKNRKTTQKNNSTFGTSRHVWVPSQHRQLYCHWYSSFQQLPSSYGAYKPFHEEHEFSCGICGTDNPFWSQASSKASQLLCLRIKRQNATSVKLKTTSLLCPFTTCPGSYLKDENTRLWGNCCNRKCLFEDVMLVLMQIKVCR